MQKLLRDVPRLESVPDMTIVESIPNRGKIYYGEDIQMITLLKKRLAELRERKCTD
jgi:hypothetical protein